MKKLQQLFTSSNEPLPATPPVSGAAPVAAALSTNSKNTGNFKSSTEDKVAKIFSYSGYESTANLHTGMYGIAINTSYEIEPLTLTCYLNSLPNNDVDFMHYRFCVDLLLDKGKTQSLLIWDINQYNFNGKMIYQVLFKNGLVTDIAVEISQSSLQLEFYIKDLRNGQKFPLNSYNDKPYPISLNLRVYNDQFE